MIEILLALVVFGLGPVSGLIGCFYLWLDRRVSLWPHVDEQGKPVWLFCKRPKIRRKIDRRRLAGYRNVD